VQTCALPIYDLAPPLRLLHQALEAGRHGQVALAVGLDEVVALVEQDEEPPAGIAAEPGRDRGRHARRQSSRCLALCDPLCDEGGPELLPDGVSRPRSSYLLRLEVDVDRDVIRGPLEDPLRVAEQSGLAELAATVDVRGPAMLAHDAIELGGTAVEH